MDDRSETPLSRRAVLIRAAALGLGAPFTAALAGCMDREDRRGMMDGMMDEMPPWMMSSGSMAGMREDMSVIHTLLVDHEQIDRQVEDIPNGIRSTTISENAEIAEAIRTHVWQMKERVEDGRPIRQMDPLFREIFRHHEQIEMEIEGTEGGVRVTETSDDPQVALLIRQHAHRAVSEFVAFGMQRAMQPTPLPEGYEDASDR